MPVRANTTVLELKSDADWRSLLYSLVDDDLRNAAAANIVEQLREAGVQGALVENDYLDRDYSEEFSAFYSRLFRRYRRRTRRIHFFRSDLATIAERDGLLAVKQEMCACNERGDYLGFLVVRPVIDASIGRTVLRTLRAPPGMGACIQVRATYETHPLGTTLQVKGMPFTQQDQRISACAQASIWMSGRHFNARHAGPWFSTVAITEAASKPTDLVLSSSVPAGSSGLSINNMLRALRAMDRHPYAFAGDLTPDGHIIWPPSLSPQAMLSRYVGSGIPVIAGLSPWASNQNDGHAVVVIGDTFKPLDVAVLQTSRPTMAELSPYFLVHDDQRGVNLRMPLRANMEHAETPYNILDHLQFIIVPLPDKVFITAETAEITAWDRLNFYVSEWPGLKAKHGGAIGSSVNLGDRVAGGATQNQIIARTYLTHGWKYKARLHEHANSTAMRSHVAIHELPRMVWVTEFALLQDVNFLDPEARRIFGHCVTDATSTGPTQPPLIVHMPGFLWLNTHEDPEFYAESTEALFPQLNDTTYRPRVRTPS